MSTALPYRIPTGDFVGGQWRGPYWTPFAQAIADNYPLQVPWYSTISFDLAAAAAGVPSRQTLVTGPYLYDVMVFGAGIQGNAAHLPMIGVQITHQESGVPWAVPTVTPFIPLGAFGGIAGGASPLFQFPDVFFWPKGTQLKWDFTLIDTATGNPDPGKITLAGVKLVGADAPKEVPMPDGSWIRPDARLPLFLTVGIGERNVFGGSLAYFLNVATRRLQFLPPIECDVEVHDVSTSLISGAFTLTPDGASSVALKTQYTSVQNQWQPFAAPITAVAGGLGAGAGGVAQIYPSLPYTKPYLLPKGSRIQLDFQNNSILTTFTNGYITFRCVRRCEYT